MKTNEAAPVKLEINRDGTETRIRTEAGDTTVRSTDSMTSEIIFD
jgi:hypothetical protein